MLKNPTVHNHTRCSRTPPCTTTQPQVEANLVIPATELADEGLVNPATQLTDESLVNPATKLANETLVNLATELSQDNETTIGAVYVKKNQA